MKTLVTGADGLLGSHLVRELLARGHAVRALVQEGSRAPTLDGLEVERRVGDLLDRESLREACRGADNVVHCAALTDIFAADERHWAVNLDGTRNVAEACLAAGVQRMLFVGSASSFGYGTRDCPGDERTEFPEAYRGIAYMESKRAAMELVREFVATRGLNATIVAPTFLLGEHDWRPSSGALIQTYLNRGFPLVPGGGRNFAFAPDVASAAITALEKGRAGDATILGGHNLSYEEFFGLVAECSGAPAPRAVVPARIMDAAGQLAEAAAMLTGRSKTNPVRLSRTVTRLSTLHTYYSSDKAGDELAMPLTPIRRAIQATLRSLRAFGHLPADPLAGKVALISGASRGVGYATARALACRGVKVVISARGEARLLDSHEKLANLGADVRAVVGDVGHWADAEAMVETAVDSFGGLDMLINNAGVSMRGSFAELSPEVCKQTVRTNLLGPIYLTRAAATHIRARQGHVLFVSSIAGIVGLPNASTYCASKSALTGLAESLRLELGPAGVHVGVVYLGFTEHDPEKRVLSADGSPLLPDRPAHHTQAHVAEAILGMVEARRRSLVLTPIGNIGNIAHRLSPALVEGVVARAQASQWPMFRAFS